MSKLYFILTLDTEEEWDWSKGFSKDNFTIENTKRIPEFQRFCKELGIRPTYLVNYPIVADKESVKRLRTPYENGECEIGGHLHPWCNPPFEEEICAKNSHAISLGIDLVKKKLQNLGKKIENEFGQRPRSFRSGRWGTNGTLLKALAEEGYEIDSSIRPFYSDPGFFSYLKAPTNPYWPDFNNFLVAGEQREMLEIPVTEGFNIPNFQLAQKIHPFLAKKPIKYLRLTGILWRLGLFRKVTLGLEHQESEDITSHIDTFICRGNRFLVSYFHTSSLIPKGTPYVPNETNVKAIWKKLADLVTYLNSKYEVCFCTLSEAKAHHIKECSGS